MIGNCKKYHCNYVIIISVVNEETKCTFTNNCGKFFQWRKPLSRYVSKNLDNKHSRPRSVASDIASPHSIYVSRIAGTINASADSS